MYCWGQYHYAAAYEWVESVPAINDQLMMKVKQQVEASGVLAIFMGPMQGLPFKTFAVQAHAANVSISEFILISIPARLLRFLAIACIARWLALTLLKNLQRKHLVAVWGGAWLLVYGVYFYHFPS